MLPRQGTFSRAIALGIALSFSSAVYADYTVRCGSVGGRHNTCRLSQPGYVTVERKVSGASCDQGRSWDFDRREIWVDRGCEADFRVETHDESSSGNRDAAKVVGAVAAIAILGALAANKDHVDDGRYRDENYYGSQHTSYVPRWMVGTFRGYNAQYGADVEMRIEPDGRMTANAQGQTIRGWVNDRDLHVGGAVFSIDQTREGFVTAQRGERFNEVRYRRVF
jgi:hypothetical protein